MSLLPHVASAGASAAPATGEGDDDDGAYGGNDDDGGGGNVTGRLHVLLLLLCQYIRAVNQMIFIGILTLS